MIHFLSIVLRNQFNLFYRFGYTFIPKSELIEFDGKITEKIKDQIVGKFVTTTPFEYDEEYLILHLEKPTSDDNTIRFETQDIVAIYPLSQQAKVSIESRIDQRIKLEKPIFETVLPKIETEIEKKEVEKAISALWTICKIENSLEEYLSNIDIEKIFKGLEYRKTGMKANNIQNGNYWEYLIAYDRFDYFPNSILGYFYDAGQVFAFSKGLQTFEGSGLHEFLEIINSENSTIKLPEIIKYLETEEKLHNYVSQTTIGDTKQYIVAPLYLMLRDEIRKSDDITQTNLFKYLDKFKEIGDSFYYAVILIGGFFGFRKFYDLYYDTLDLRFYKSYKEPIKEVQIDTTKKSVKKEKKKIENNNIVENTEEKLPLIETQAEELVNNADLTQRDEQEKTDSLSQYHAIISDTLKKQSPIKLTELATLIKTKTGKKFDNRSIKNILKEMNEIEIIRINKAEAVRRKEPTLL